MDVAARLEAVEAENERLRARIDVLEGAMGMEFVPPFEWRLTGSEARVFGVLYERNFATKDAIMAALYRDDGRDEAEIKIVDVFICKLRQKLKPFGIEIETVWGTGYQMTAENKRKVAEMLDDGVLR